MSDHPDNVPKTPLLFKGKPGGKIYDGLQANPRVRDWMKLQVQEEGSYRSKDMVEVLDWMLPQAHSPDESIIVLLDWFSGHLTEEVAALVEIKGHVLLFSRWRHNSFHADQRHASACNVAKVSDTIRKRIF